jgi:hypothetical protein
MSNEVETSTTNGQPDQQAAPKAPSKKEKKKGMKKSSCSQQRKPEELSLEKCENQGKVRTSSCLVTTLA